MRSIMKTYSHFLDLVESIRFCGGGNLVFEDYCRYLEVSPYSLEEVILKETGKTADEFLCNYTPR